MGGGGGRDRSFGLDGPHGFELKIGDIFRSDNAHECNHIEKIDWRRACAKYLPSGRSTSNSKNCKRRKAIIFVCATSESSIRGRIICICVSLRAQSYRRTVRGRHLGRICFNYSLLHKRYNLFYNALVRPFPRYLSLSSPITASLSTLISRGNLLS